MRSTDAGDLALAAAAGMVASNPPDAGAPVRLLFELQGHGLDLNDIPEEDLRGVAAILGLDELEEQEFLEDASGWLGRPL